MHIILHRLTQSEKGTFGILLMNDLPLCATLELPWEDNKRDISCIPEGVYGCTRFISPRHGKVWKINDVSGRTDVLFHVANKIDELLGCVAVGQSFGKNMILNSTLAFKGLQKTLPDSFALSVTSRR